jgi:UDPglucose 6-dehydrogenase
VNATRVEAFVEKIRSVLGGLSGRRIALWGLSFKPETDDLRNAPAVEVARRLLDEGAFVSAHDPAAMPVAKLLLPDVALAAAPNDAARGADCVVICTEWSEYAAADLERLRAEMTQPVVVDGRNLFRPADMAAAGFTYASVGRRTVRPPGAEGSG